MPRGGADSLADRYRAALGEARERTLALVAGVSEQNLSRQHDRLMSPLVWDLGHIAAFEDLWLCQRVGGLDPLRPELAEVYDAAETPRAVRGNIRHLALPAMPWTTWRRCTSSYRSTCSTAPTSTRRDAICERASTPGTW